jgi:hypothetical protein
MTDRLRAYHDAFNKEFYNKSNPRSRHVNDIKFRGQGNEANKK